jgi:cephalosporin-C deacetylase-like acetyl esterase
MPHPPIPPSSSRYCWIPATAVAGGLLLANQAGAQAQQPESWLGTLTPVIQSIQRERGFPLSFAHRGGVPVETWRARGRDAVARALAYTAAPVPLDLKVHAVVPREGYEIRVISFAGSAHYRVPAFLVVPTTGRGPYPGIVALHDHGGWFVHGKEKLVRMEGEPAALAAFREQLYGGRAWAEDLARRGFVVIVTDAFYWGERRLQYEHPPEALRQRLAGFAADSADYLKALNGFLGEQTPVLQTWLAFAGTTWMGIVSHDDRRSVDVLASLPEVDPRRLGCAGLSGGGFRAAYLAGLDPRVTAAVVTAWMTSLPTTLDLPYKVHASLFDAFTAHADLDHPDIASLGAPACALFVQDCGQDHLFTRAGMDAAAETLRGVYAALGAPERYQARVYDAPHQFNAAMQADALAWLERWLGPETRRQAAGR